MNSAEREFPGETELSTRLKPSVREYLGRPGLSELQLRAFGLLVAPIVICVVLRLVTLPTEHDTWWHILTGQLIYETGIVPRTEIYSHTLYGHPWITHEWLTEVLMYLVQRGAGYVGNVALFGAMGALTWLLVYITCRQRGLGEVLAAFFTLYGAALDLPSIVVRPHMLTALLFALFAWLLLRYRQGDRRAVWPMPLLMVLWVNLHGGYIIGLILLGLTLVGELAARGLRQPSAPLRPLLIATLLSTAATSISPHGIDALRYPFSYSGTTNASMRYIAEWQSPNFHQPYHLLLFGSLMLPAILGLKRRPLGPTDVLYFLLFAFMALVSVRHTSLYAIITMPLLGARLQAEFPALGRSLAAWQSPRLLGVTWLMVIIMGVQLVTAARNGSLLQISRTPSAATFPAGGAAYLRAHPGPGQLFNDYDWGGYLIYELYPQQRVFIDGRADVYDGRVMEAYQVVKNVRPGWRQVLEQYDVRKVLVPKNSSLAGALMDDPEWQEVYVGDVERLFIRQG